MRPVSWTSRFTIRTRLVVLLLALALPFLIYVALSARRQTDLERDDAGQRMLGVARLTAARLNDHIGDIRQLLAVLRAVAGTTTADIARNDAVLASLIPTLPPHINNLAVWSVDGGNVGALHPRLRDLPLDIRQRPFFVGAMQGAEMTVEAPARALLNGERVGIFAMPIQRDGRIVGVVTASTLLEPLQSLLLPEHTLPPGAVITVSDASGVVLARSIDPEHWIGRNLLRQGGLADSLRRREGVRDGPSADGIERIAGFTTAERVPWLIYVGVPTQVALAPVQRRMAETLGVGLLLFTIGVVLAARIGGRIASPLRQLSDDAAALESGNLAHRSRVSDGGEIGLLAATVNRMADALQERTALLETSRERLAQITDNLPVMISYVDGEQRFQFANRVYRDWLGVDPDALIGQTLESFYGHATYATFAHHIASALAGERVVYERDFDSLAGRRRVEVTALPHTDAGGHVHGLFVLMRDVTAEREAQALRARSEERLSLAIEGSGLALFDWDIVADRVYMSAQAAVLRGEPAREATETSATLQEHVHPEDRERVDAAMMAAIRGAAPRFLAEFRVCHATGGWTWLQGQGRVVERAADGRALRLAGTYADITDRRAAEERLRRLAEFDTLTGLPNRALFIDRLEQALARGLRRQVPIALLFLDVDHFKTVNDSLGHAAGDELLCAFAQLLCDSLRASDTVARLGGDEFTVILEDLHDIEDAKRVAATLVTNARRTVVLADGQHTALSTSIGIAMQRPGESDSAALLRRADTALYEAKRRGRDGHACADDFEADPTSIPAAF